MKMKKILAFTYTLLFALLLSGATGANPLFITPAVFGASLLVGLNQMPKGALYAVTMNSAFDGSNITNILSLIVLGAESIQKGLLHTIPNKYDKIYMPKLDTAANQIQARVATPTVSADSVYSERLISPMDMMWYQEFNPATFEHAWADFWPKGPMVNQIQDPKVMAAIVKTVRGSINTQLDLLIWQGDESATGTEFVFFDGFLKTMTADAAVIKHVITAPIDATNIQAELDAMITAMPPAIRNNKNPKFIVSHATFDAFGQYTMALDYKGDSIFDSTTARYRGFSLIPVGGMTDNNIVFADATTGPEGNLFAGTWLANDRENFKIERLQANSEMFFLKSLFRYGVNYGKSEEIVLGTYTAP